MNPGVGHAIGKASTIIRAITDSLPGTTIFLLTSTGAGLHPGFPRPMKNLEPLPYSTHHHRWRCFLYPNASVSHSFAAGSSIPWSPILATIMLTSVSSVVAIFNNQTAVNLFEFGGGQNANLSSGRWTRRLEGLEPGNHSIRLIAYDAGGNVVANSQSVSISVDPFSGSLPPGVDLHDLVVDTATSTSVIPLSADGTDQDGSFEGVQFYVDGVPYGGEILRPNGLAQDLATYSSRLNLNAPGIKTIFALGWDNSGNYVASQIRNLSVTTGSNPAEIELTSGPASMELNSSHISVFVTDNTTINTISLVNGVLGSDYVTAPRIDVVSASGSGAEIEPILNDNGSITGFTVINGGTGYSADTQLIIVPVVRAIGYGEPASVRMGVTREFNATSNQNEFVSHNIRLELDFEGNPRGGSGYITAPLFRTIDPTGRRWNWNWNGQNLNRLPLEETNSTTTSVAQFSISPLTQEMSSHVLLGGFTHSPVMFNFEISQTTEDIDRVYFVVDGRVEEVKENGPFAFALIPDEPKDHSVYALVRDKAGNLNDSEEISFSSERFVGGGVSLNLKVENGLEVESNSNILLSADVSSEFGVAEIEFFLDGESLGVVEPLFEANNYSFVHPVNLGNITLGRHYLSAIAKDNQGNQAGTFDSLITNIKSRQNKSFICTTALPPSRSPVVSITGPGSGLSTTHASTIRLEANASDPDGDLEGVSFYVNGEELYTWSGVIEFMGLPADGDVLTIDDGTGRNKPTIFEFDDNDVVIGGPTPLALASELNQLDDLVVSGNFTNPQSLNFKVEIDGTGTTDTFRWSIDGGISYIEERWKLFEDLPNPWLMGFQSLLPMPLGMGLGITGPSLAVQENVVVPISRNKKGFPGCPYLVNPKRPVRGHGSTAPSGPAFT